MEKCWLILSTKFYGCASPVTSRLQLKIHLCEKQGITLIKPSLSMLMATFDILDFKKFQNIFTGHFFPIGTDPGTFRFFKISVFDILPPDLMYGDSPCHLKVVWPLIEQHINNRGEKLTWWAQVAMATAWPPPHHCLQLLYPCIVSFSTFWCLFSFDSCIYSLCSMLHLQMGDESEPVTTWKGRA